MLEGLLSAVRNAVAPARCIGCNCISCSVFCEACGASPISPQYDELEGVPLVAAGAYQGALANGIRRFKYGSQPALARPLASLLVPAAERMNLPKSVVWVPVPLHYARLVERGFNQAALLGAVLARATRTRFAPRALERRRETMQQAQLKRSLRLDNMSGAFGVRGTIGGEVLLIDDVVTTGATATACMLALREKGVKVRAVFTLARTHPL
jgi:ComF family protein